MSATIYVGVPEFRLRREPVALLAFVPAHLATRDNRERFAAAMSANEQDEGGSVIVFECESRPANTTELKTDAWRLASELERHFGPTDVEVY